MRINIRFFYRKEHKDEEQKCLALLIGAGLYAQNAESDFETDGQGTITEYTSWDAAVVIPAQIGGKPVTAIGENAFAKNDLTANYANRH